VIAAGTPLKVSLAATAASVVLVLVVFELIRSRRLREQYALLWLVTGIVLVILSAWRGGLNTIAGWLGVRGYPPAVLFAVGLLGASLLAAAILPVTAAYVIAETFGFEKGIKHRPREAPVFVGVITTLIATGTIVALIPGIPVFKLLVGVQVVNGVLLPITLFFVWRLASNRKLMGEYANGRTFNILAGATVIATSTLSLLLLVVTFTGG